MQLRFQSIDEETPGARWRGHFDRVWPSYSAWFLSEGEARRPGYVTCRRALTEHVPELVPVWERLAELGGGGDQVARMLSLWCPPAYLVSCSQAVWTRDEPMLVRNYDYHPGACEGLFMKTSWRGTPVIASIDSLWGVLDGMNQHGLAVSLAFGGRREVGAGFGIPLLLRAALEGPATVAEAAERVARIPSHMSYSVSMVDAAGGAATVHVGPGQPGRIVDQPVATNHQDEPVWLEHARLTRSLERSSFLERCLADPRETAERFASRFQAAPVVASMYERAFGTLYTAVYRPARGTVEIRWHGRSWQLGFDDFFEGDEVVVYGPASGSPAFTGPSK